MDEFDGQYEDIHVHFVGPYPDVTSDPEEIMIDDIKRPRKTEAYTIVHLQTDCEGKTNDSIQVKVYTKAGSNVMPLSMFERLYLKQINLNVEPIGLETKPLNSMHIMELKFHNMEHLNVH